MVGRRLEEGKQKERREMGGRGSEGNRPLITDVGEARSRFCWEAFIAHEKADCLLKNYLHAGGEERELEGSQGAGDCSCPGAVGWVGEKNWNLGSSRCHSHWVGKGFFCISRLLHPWLPQTTSLGRCLCGRLSLPLPSSALFWHLYRSFWRWPRVPGPQWMSL